MGKEALDSLLNLPKPIFEADLPLDRVDLNPYQPRDPIGEEDIEGMKAHIRSGILEPIIVHQKGGGFELIAGERRLRAAKALGMTAIPVMIYPELTPGPWFTPLEALPLGDSPPLGKLFNGARNLRSPHRAFYRGQNDAGVGVKSLILTNEQMMPHLEF